jgi:hypothetical protein
VCDDVDDVEGGEQQTMLLEHTQRQKEPTTLNPSSFFSFPSTSSSSWLMNGACMIGLTLRHCLKMMARILCA